MARKTPATATESPAGTIEGPSTPGREDGDQVLLISAQHDGYRRAGRAWSRVAQEIPAAELTVAQIAALEADPRITVQRVV